MSQTSYKGIMAQVSGSNSVTRGQIPAKGAMILQSEQRWLQIQYFDKMKWRRWSSKIKNLQEQLNEDEIGNLPEKEFSVMIVRMCQGLRKNLEAQIEKIQKMFNKKGMATHSSIFAWRIPRTQGPGGLQSMGSQRIEHNRASNTYRRTPQQR